MCATYYNGKVIHPAQAIASGIDGMQVLYGVSDTPDTAFRSSVNRFISLADLGANIDWDTVTAVRIAVLTRSFNERSASENKRSYVLDRKSTRLNSSHVRISYAVFCLKKKT